jgi:hypothetical protein
MRKQQIPPSYRQLIEAMQNLNFGRILGLCIRLGEPDFSRPYKTVRTVKLAGDNGARPEASLEDFELCKEQIGLIDQISSLPDGTRVTIELKHGKPFLVEIEQNHNAA